MLDYFDCDFDHKERAKGFHLAFPTQIATKTFEEGYTGDSWTVFIMFLKIDVTFINVVHHFQIDLKNIVK